MAGRPPPSRFRATGIEWGGATGNGGIPLLDLRVHGADVVAKADADVSEEKILRGMPRTIEGVRSLSIALEWNPLHAGIAPGAQIQKSFEVFRIVETHPGTLVSLSSRSQIRRRFTNL